jgi:Fic family protein
MKSFLTFKSGKFYFSDQYDELKIKPLLAESKVLNEIVKDLPVLPKLAAQLNPDIIYSSISGTAMIEGNPITSEGVKKLAQGEDIEIYTKKDKQEIRNLLEAYTLLSGIESKTKPFLLTEAIIKKLHEIITRDVPYGNNIPGQYRNGIVHVGDEAHGGIYTPPKILEDIKNLMVEYIDWINSEAIVTLDPFIRAALAHYYFCVIHPFWDGNGRTARLIEAMLLQTANIKYVPKELSNYYYRNVDDYYIAFSKNIKLKKEVTPFLEFALTASVVSLSSIKMNIIFFIRKFILRDFYTFENKRKAITKRQFDLLSLLLDNSIELTLKDLLEKNPYALLYRKVSSQTARRDLKKLVDKNLLNRAGNKYMLNFRALD